MPRASAPTAEHPAPPAENPTLTVLRRIAHLLDDIRWSLEDEPDFDQTFIVGGNPAAAVAIPFTIPRTLHHVEITLSVTAAVEVAVLPGNVPTAQAAGQHNHNAGQTGQSNAICTSGGGSVTARDYLDGSGILTVYFAAAASAYANVRVRSLDRSQERAVRG